MNANNYLAGIDIGSTTAKIVILNNKKELVFSAYRRHNAEILATLNSMLHEANRKLCNGNDATILLGLMVTGSAGLGIAEKYSLPFIQEVVASAEVVHQRYPQVRTLIDIGGEDAKIIFFDEHYRPDMRMNGSCAGGTGAFIDEMATLLNVPVEELDNLASRHSTIYPMASRCGVFAKTDLQNLLSRQVPKEDIAASVFHAVVLQSLATLARGREVLPTILFSGGPLTFMPELKQAFLKVLNFTDDQVVRADYPELLPAIGAALAPGTVRQSFSIHELIDTLSKERHYTNVGKNRHAALFDSMEEFQSWSEAQRVHRIERTAIEVCQEEDYFLGIDSGSTTTKVVLIDAEGKVVFDFYTNNGGNSIIAAQRGLSQLHQAFESRSFLPRIARSAVTGYGEDLIHAAFGIDMGMVETMAHYRAAKAFDPQVTFILDIGGQDMKAIFIKDGQIQKIEINEACSSGCGSFVESFARGMGYTVADFARTACKSDSPYDLGTRCTVFMNSRVKQALREGAPIQDISAGLAFSVIKNALYKVLKITNTDVLGDHIVVQGGTFRNPAVQKALEEMIGRPVVCPDMAELMGAYGAALAARDGYMNGENSASTFVGLQDLDRPGEYVRKDIRCRGCENKCVVTKLGFPNGNYFFSGNRCEKIYSNGGKAKRKGVSIPALKYQLLFDREIRTSEPETRPNGLTIGIPRVLNLFENYPFWHALFVECGLQVRLSAPSSNALYQDGATHIMSENLCYPAKLASGHIIDLIKAGVDRIFYPMVFFEKGEFTDANNSFNCPVISGYPDVMRVSIDPGRQLGIPLDMPPISFLYDNLLDKACLKYLTDLGIAPRLVKEALLKAKEAQSEFKKQVIDLGAELIQDALTNGRPVIVLMGRPYHIDPLINHNIPDLLTDMGVDVITEDCIPMSGESLNNRYVMTQWEYSNRYFHAAKWVGMHENIELVLLNSFGCGPDAYILEEIRQIMAEYGKQPTIIRIDEIESAGSTRLRLRSMMEALRQTGDQKRRVRIPRKTTRTYQEDDLDRTLLVPDFSPFTSPPIVRPFMDMGFNIVQLPVSNHESVEVGLKYTNNEICYPAIIALGDLVKALQSGKFDPSKTAVGFSQTGGQCRATSIASMIKKALVAAGFEQVPVVTLATSLNALNDQPGFKFDKKEYIYKSAIGMMFCDALSDMYYSSIIRENKKGATQETTGKYLNAYMDGGILLTKVGLLDALEQAVYDFNNIATTPKILPRAGIVGEIYVKYNSFSNNHADEWLMEQGIEVVLPSFFEFFDGGMVSFNHGVKTFVKRRDLNWLVAVLGQRLAHHFLHQFEEVKKGYRYHRPRHCILDVAEHAKEILSLNHQYGEGWLIAGEIASYARDGVTNVLCLQPFGCIANHIVAKGVQKKLQETYPQLNLLFLDADAGVSEVNFFNRMHFFANHAKAEANCVAEYA